MARFDSKHRKQLIYGAAMGGIIGGLLVASHSMQQQKPAAETAGNFFGGLLVTVAVLWFGRRWIRAAPPTTPDETVPATRFSRLRRILAVVAVLFIAISAGIWWRGYAAAAARAAWIKTVQDAGFQVGETLGIIALPFDITLPGMFDELLTLHLPSVAINSSEDAERLRKLLKTCPKGTTLYVPNELFDYESREMQRHFPNANVMPMSLWDPFGTGGTMSPMMIPLETEQPGSDKPPQR